METPASLTSYEGIACTVCINDVLGVRFQYWERLNLVIWKDTRRKIVDFHTETRGRETDARNFLFFFYLWL